MSRFQLRNLSCKKFKEGLFLFDCDKKTDICPTRYVIDDDDQVYEGNTVTVKYGTDYLRATIVKLSGMFFSTSIKIEMT